MRRALEVLRLVKAIGARAAPPVAVQLPTPPSHESHTPVAPPAAFPPRATPITPTPPPATVTPSVASRPLEISGGDLAQALALLDRAADAMVQSGEEVKTAVSLLRKLHDALVTG